MATLTSDDYVPAAEGRAPTLEDARLGAEVLRAAGARKVIAFGSIARGEQTEDSDLDLAAIFDDIDYDRRKGQRSDLCERVIAATGFDVDVVLSDFPEWNRRVRNVPTCLEAAIATHGQVLIDEPPLQSGWRHKEMVIAMSPRSEALHRLTDVGRKLGSAIREVDGLEVWLARVPAAERDTSRVRMDEDGQRRQVLGHLHLAYETALKALLAQHGDSPPKVHKTAELEDRLPEPHKTVALGIRGDLPHREIQYRHVDANYSDDDIPTAEEIAASVPGVAMATAAIAEYAAQQYELSFGSCDETALILQHAAAVRERLGRASADLPSGGTGS